MIYTDNRQEKLNVDEEFINSLEAVCDFVLKKEGVNCKYQISLLFVDNEEIREINRETRNIDRATDVLSFPLIDFDNEDLPNDGSKIYLGDIIISIERAKEQANEYGHSLDREVGFLTAHSMLHLLGYDHMVPEEEKVMFAKQEEILSNLGLKR